MNIKYTVIVGMLCCAGLTAFAQKSDLPRKVVNGKEFYVYKVAHAEGFYSVSNKFDVSQEEIIKYNPTAKSGLKDGQILLIPIAGSEESAGTASTARVEEVEEISTFKHTIKRGESLYSISKMYGVTVDAIKGVNPGLTSNIKAGAKLNIPQKATKKRTTKPATASQTTTTTSTETATQETAVDYTYHNIARGETLYAISQHYNCSVEDILRANPGLKPNKLFSGSVIRIPVKNAVVAEAPVVEVKPDTGGVESKYDTYEVKKKETFYSIAKKLDITVDELKAANPGKRSVKKGDMINIPKPKVDVAQTKPVVVNNEEVESIYNRIYERKNAQSINVAVILPFMLEHKPDIKASLYTEYYQGFLMAVDSMKRQGFSVNVHAYDTEGSLSKVKNILSQSEMKSMHLIIAPDNDEMINLISDFGEKYAINVVNTFSMKNEKFDTNAYVFQTNIPHSYLYAETVERFIRRFGHRDIVFLTSSADTTETYEFVETLQAELAANNIPYRTCTYSKHLTKAQLSESVGGASSVVFVPTSNKHNTTKAIIPGLVDFVDNNPQCRVSLFGFPGWIVQANKYLDEFYKLDTYLFSRFYTDPSDANKLDFDLKFHYWYGDEMINASPQYGLLGFDTGIYFLQAIARNGKNFANYDLPGSNSLQTDFKFERINNWSGFINKSFYFIHYTPYMTTEKIKE